MNPDPPKIWSSTQTARAVASIFPMYPLSVDGIGEAVTALIGGRRQGTTVH